MRGVYTAEIEIAALLPAAGDGLLTLECPGDMVLEILSASVTNMDTDVAEQIACGLFDITDETSLAGTAIVPRKHEQGDVASSVTALGAGNAGMAGEPDVWASKAYDRQGANNLAGYRYDPIPEERPIVSPGKFIGLRMLTVPAAAFKAAVQIVYREIGG